MYVCVFLYTNSKCRNCVCACTRKILPGKNRASRYVSWNQNMHDQRDNPPAPFPFSCGNVSNTFDERMVFLLGVDKINMDWGSSDFSHTI